MCPLAGLIQTLEWEDPERIRKATRLIINGHNLDSINYADDIMLIAITGIKPQE